MRGIHERKWEIDSLCYVVRLAYHYWKVTGDDSVLQRNGCRWLNLSDSFQRPATEGESGVIIRFYV